MANKDNISKATVDVIKIQNIKVRIVHKFMGKSCLLDIYFKLAANALKENIPIDV